MDTGGLGLLQLLIQSGIPPQALLALLQHQQTLGQPEINSGGGGPGGPGPAGSTTSGEGTPGVGPTDGTTTGIGALSGSDAASAFGSGLGNGGAIGQAGQALGMNGTATGIGAKAGMGLLGMLGGFPTAPFSLANSIIGGLAKLADAAQRSHGPRGSTPNLADILRNRVEEPTPPSVPGDPTAPGLPSGIGPVSADLSFTGNAISDPNDPAVTAAIDAAVSSAVTGEGTGVPGSGEGPGGNAGAPSGGGDSGNPGDF